MGLRVGHYPVHTHSRVFSLSGFKCAATYRSLFGPCWAGLYYLVCIFVLIIFDYDRCLFIVFLSSYTYCFVLVMVPSSENILTRAHVKRDDILNSIKDIHFTAWESRADANVVPSLIIHVEDLNRLVELDPPTSTTSSSASIPKNYY